MILIERLSSTICSRCGIALATERSFLSPERLAREVELIGRLHLTLTGGTGPPIIRPGMAVLAADVADTVPRLSITQIGRAECCSGNSLFDRSTFHA